MKELLTKAVNGLTNYELSSLCVYLNEEYRAGKPEVSDEAFDFVYMAALRERVPNHPLLTAPQPTVFETSKGRVQHPSPMLSTDKAYELEEVESYVTRCEKAALAADLNPNTLQYRVLAKLDGIAGRLVATPKQLITRGDGAFGNDISHLIEAGLKIVGNEYLDGVGEVVMPMEYFEKNLAEHFAHPRNLISGMASSDSLNKHALQAMKDGAVHLVLYRDMPEIVVDGKTLISQLDQLVDDTKASSPYPLDGTIIEVIGEELRAAMGSGSHHHNWQIAKKESGETAETTVKDIVWQVGRTGRVTPVIHIEQTTLSGAKISKVTGHHAANVRNNGIGKGAKVVIIRAGEVIPKYLKTTQPVKANLLTECPCCTSDLVWKKSPQTDKDTFLVCENIGCSAQSATGIIHFFKTIQCDLFGAKSVEKLVNAEYKCVEQILLMNEEAFMAVGFGAGQAKNLVAEMQRVMREPLRDNLLLASLGISKLGRSASEKLLAKHRITELKGISAEQIEAIEGFGEITSVNISKALSDRADTLDFLLSRNFNLSHTQDTQALVEGGSLDGVNIVFTGSMTGSRDEMKADAKAKGANVQSGVNGKTHVLCCGAKVGQKKLDAAREKGVEIITEEQYWERYAA
jgi:DNA ligase (NAD+)